MRLPLGIELEPALELYRRYDLWDRGLRIVVLGLILMYLSHKYHSYLESHRCPYCKAEVPDGADICPACYRSQLQVEGLSILKVLGVAFSILVFLCAMVVVFLLP